MKAVARVYGPAVSVTAGEGLAVWVGLGVAVTEPFRARWGGLTSRWGATPRYTVLETPHPSTLRREDAGVCFA